MQRSRTAPAAARYTPSLVTLSRSRSRRTGKNGQPATLVRPRLESKPAYTRAHSRRTPTTETAPTETEPLPPPTIGDRANWPHVRAPPAGTGLGGNLPDLTDLATGRAFVVLATAGMNGLRGHTGGRSSTNPFAWAVRF